MKAITSLLFLAFAIYSTEAGKGLMRMIKRTEFSYYYFSETKHNFADSRKYCQNLGGDLVTINDAAEQKFLFDALKNFKLQIPYIGYNDIKTERKFVWLQDQSSYTNWCTSEPNNFGGDEDCTTMRLYNGGCWNDVHCHNKESFICEKKQTVVS